MKESKQKLCKLPKCQKEIYDGKSLFCGEHERIFRDLRKKAAISTTAITLAAIAKVAKNTMNKKT